MYANKNLVVFILSVILFFTLQEIKADELNQDEPTLKTAEYVSLGHPDKTADFISCYILDQLIKQDNQIKYAVEVMIKDNVVVLGGEITGDVELDKIENYVKEALREIGYDESYAKIWKDWAININKIKVINLIGKQSPQINQGVVNNGWGDQGVFVGFACRGENSLNKELFLARKLNNALYKKAKESRNLGLDIKTQITLDNKGKIKTAIVAVPMLGKEDLKPFIIDVLREEPEEIIINGTGEYKIHSSVADCGVTGRKLACDFYSTACPIGGGSPWTKDASKADLTLNLYARKLAKQYLRDNDASYVYLSSCIGRSKLPSAVLKTVRNGKISYKNLDIHKKPDEIIKELGLHEPVFAELCKNGLIQ